MAPKIRIQEYLNDAEVEASMLSNPMKKNALECVRLFRVWALSNELAVELGERTDNPEHVRNAEECLREL